MTSFAFLFFEARTPNAGNRLVHLSTCSHSRMPRTAKPAARSRKACSASRSRLSLPYSQSPAPHCSACHLFSIITANSPARRRRQGHGARPSARRSLFPRGTATRPQPRPALTDGGGHCARLIVAFEAELHAGRPSCGGRNLLRPPDSTTKHRKRPKRCRPVATATGCGGGGGGCIELSVIKTGVVIIIVVVGYERLSATSTPQDITQTAAVLYTIVSQ